MFKHTHQYIGSGFEVNWPDSAAQQVLQKEDIDIVESVQRGMKTPAYEQGRFVCSANGKGESEQAVHHFHSLYLEAITQYLQSRELK